MPIYNIGLSTDKKTAYVTIGAEALPVTATDVLNDFHHDHEDDEVDNVAENHTLYHHVQEALYHEGILNMQEVKIVKHGIFWNARALQVTEVGEIEEADTATLEIFYLPNLDEATNSHFTFESDDEDVATVSDAGVITGVAEGTAEITITHKDLPELTATVTVEVVPAAVE